MLFFRLALVFCCFALHAASPDSVLGVWNTTDGDGRVEIYKCGDHYCGKIIDLKEKIYPADDDRGMAGRAKVDRENPDKSRHNDPVIGMMVMQGFHFDGSIWTGGTIYDPENGKTYKCKLTLVDEKTLKVRGFIGFSLLGRNEIWTR